MNGWHKGEAGSDLTFPIAAEKARPGIVGGRWGPYQSNPRQRLPAGIADRFGIS
jgi:hypothetical protein